MVALQPAPSSWASVAASASRAHTRTTINACLARAAGLRAAATTSAANTCSQRSRLARSGAVSVSVAGAVCSSASPHSRRLCKLCLLALRCRAQRSSAAMATTWSRRACTTSAASGPKLGNSGVSGVEAAGTPTRLKTGAVGPVPVGGGNKFASRSSRR